MSLPAFAATFIYRLKRSRVVIFFHAVDAATYFAFFAIRIYACCFHFRCLRYLMLLLLPLRHAMRAPCRAVYALRASSACLHYYCFIFMLREKMIRLRRVFIAEIIISFIYRAAAKIRRCFTPLCCCCLMLPFRCLFSQRYTPMLLFRHAAFAACSCHITLQRYIQRCCYARSLMLLHAYYFSILLLPLIFSLQVIFTHAYHAIFTPRFAFTQLALRCRHTFRLIFSAADVFFRSPFAVLLFRRLQPPDRIRMPVDICRRFRFFRRYIDCFIHVFRYCRPSPDAFLALPACRLLSLCRQSFR